MSLPLIISAVLLQISLVFSLYKQLQMLQQNSYFPKRYLSWVIGSFINELTFLSFAFCLNSMLFLAKCDILCAVLCLVLLALRVFSALGTRRDSIKKLQFTARIKRFIALSLVFIIAFVALTVVFKSAIAGKYIFVITGLFGFISPIFVLLVRFLTAPAENLISRFYVNDAKKVLKRNPRLKVIGITGSFGKTTTKFILSRILSEKFNTVCTPKSFNTPMGVVRTVREMIKPSTEIFICEMGAKKKGDIKEICDIVNPDFGIITSVGPQHLDTFGSVDNVFKTKFELARAVSKKGGKTYIFTDCEDIKTRFDKDDTTLIPVGENTNYCAKNIRVGSTGSDFDLVIKDTVIPLSTRLLGLHSIGDILIACSLAFDLGISPEDIKVAVASLKPVEHRLELKSSVGGSLLIDDAYNSNPVGCLHAVRTLGTFEGMKKVIITPGLIELGEKEYEANYALGLEAAKFCDIIILVGKNRSKPMTDALESVGFAKDKTFVAPSFAAAMKIYSEFADKNTVVLLENDLPDNYLN
ncbi:MAG: UDP-N-acetylmuramoyl-tripeptide--D-alanyl-D-alanine ligase [Clostridia bacterium]|nr:UDP-N-acetylmuramoyl-tripeptide--D-alanyl-D-alanine ligase [Clostridia bacterium]